MEFKHLRLLLILALLVFIVSACNKNDDAGDVVADAPVTEIEQAEPIAETQVPDTVETADAFDAMTSQRPYRKKAFSMEEAIDELKASAGTQFSKRKVNTFVEILQSEINS